MKMTSVLLLTVVLTLAFAVPAFATGAGGAGLDFGQTHAMHAQGDSVGFTGGENPGVMHKGFSGWPHS